MDSWRKMESAPKDGTMVELKIVHRFQRYSPEDDRWTAVVKARWIDHNGGGWTWHGMMGTPHGWLPL